MVPDRKSTSSLTEHPIDLQGGVRKRGGKTRTHDELGVEETGREKKWAKRGTERTCSEENGNVPREGNKKSVTRRKTSDGGQRQKKNDALFVSFPAPFSSFRPFSLLTIGRILVW
jgi:hypothetical protein